MGLAQIELTADAVEEKVSLSDRFNRFLSFLWEVIFALVLVLPVVVLGTWDIIIFLLHIAM